MNNNKTTTEIVLRLTYAAHKGEGLEAQVAKIDIGYSVAIYDLDAEEVVAVAKVYRIATK